MVVFSDVQVASSMDTSTLIPSEMQAFELSIDDMQVGPSRI